MNFKIGQKVVCIDDSNLPEDFPVIKKGDIYTSMGLSPNTGKDLLIKERPGTTAPYFGYRLNRFAPIEPLYADCREELASQVTVGDTADQPIKVLN